MDLATAGVPDKVDGTNGPEYADFHALRHTFCSALAAAETGAKELQTLARHSDPRLTLGLYTNARPRSWPKPLAGCGCRRWGPTRTPSGRWVGKISNPSHSAFWWQWGSFSGHLGIHPGIHQRPRFWGSGQELPGVGRVVCERCGK